MSQTAGDRHSVTQASASGADYYTFENENLVPPPFSNTSISEWSAYVKADGAGVAKPPFSNTSISEWSAVRDFP